MNERLKIVATENQSSSPSSKASRRNRYIEMEARYERQWLQEPELFDPERDALERERIARTWEFLTSLADFKHKKILDIGCGTGLISERLRDAGAEVLAIDIASNALKSLEKKNIPTKKDGLPITQLPDNTYDIVLCLDVIAELDPADYRLAISELCRLVKGTGIVVCSTEVDIYSTDALERFNMLFGTEFNITQEKWNHLGCYIQLLHFVEAPAVFYKRNTRLKLFWGGLAWLLKPVVYVIKQSRPILMGMEKVCNKVSHVIVAGMRKPLFDGTLTEPSEDERPFRKEKKWE